MRGDLNIRQGRFASDGIFILRKTFRDLPVLVLQVIDLLLLTANNIRQVLNGPFLKGQTTLHIR